MKSKAIMIPSFAQKTQELSVIGPAANDAARTESLCKETKQTVLVSEKFAEGLEQDWQDLGNHAIRGSEQQIRLFTLPSLSSIV